MGWSGCTAEAQIPSTAGSWGINYGYACASSVPSYYFPGGTLQFSSCWAFDKTGKLLWKGTASQVTDTLVQGWIAASGGGNNPPTADAGTDKNAFENVNVTLDGTASADPDGDPLSYSWTQTGGSSVTLSGATTATPSFTTPTTGGAASYTFELTVNDNQGGSDTDSVTVFVNPSNYAPVANAGPDQGVVFNMNVNLSAAASTDKDGDPLSYSWTQVAGGVVGLTNANTATPTFISPATPDTLEFEVTVTDTSAASDTDRVIVYVNGSGTIPVTGGTGTGGGGCELGAGASGSALLLLAIFGMVAYRRRRA